HYRSPCPQFTLGIDTPELLPVGHAIDRGDVFRHPAAALDGDISISVVRGYHPVGEPEGAFLRQQQKPMKEPAAAIFRYIELGAQIMMVEDIFLAEELVGCGGEENEIGRIAALDHIEAAGEGDLQQEARFMKECAGIFEDEAHFAARFDRQGMAVDRYAVDFLEALR